MAYYANPRTIRQVVQDVWAALTGKTYVVVSGCCHKCDSDFHVEVYQDLQFPLHTGGIGIKSGTFNFMTYFPSQRARLEKNGMTYEPLPEHVNKPQTRSLGWQAKLGDNWLFKPATAPEKA